MTCSKCGAKIKTEPYENYNGEIFCWNCALDRAVELINRLKEAK